MSNGCTHNKSPGNDVNCNALYDAVTSKNGEEVFRILDAKPQLLNAVIDDSWKATVLHCAADQNLTTVLKNLLQREGLDIDVRNKNGCTALYYACFFGHFDMIELLLEAKADPGIPRSVCICTESTIG